MSEAQHSVSCGRISIIDGALSIVSLVSEVDRESVQEALAEFNNRPFLVEKILPKDGERYHLEAKEYHRGDVGFDEVLVRKLESGRLIRLECVCAKQSAPPTRR